MYVCVHSFVLCLLSFLSRAIVTSKFNRYLATKRQKLRVHAGCKLSRLVSTLLNNGYFRIPTCKSVINCGHFNPNGAQACLKTNTAALCGYPHASCWPKPTA